MKVQLIKKSDQARGAFDFGRILENKPLGFPHEAGVTKPFSNLFYWAHAWSDTGGSIGEHPHQGFEIMSYVLDGTISHYDNKMDAWKNLSKGDAQVIKSGNGITHAEKLLPGAHIFQIWFDPNLNESLKKPASYVDLRSDEFPIVEESGLIKKIVVGEGSPLELDSLGVEIVDYQMGEGNHLLPADADSTYGLYVINGGIQIDGSTVESDDHLIISETDSITVETNSEAQVFLIKMSNSLPYRTYAEMQGAA